MSVFRRRFNDGRLSKDWYINYRIHGKQYKRKIGPNKKLAEQIMHDIEIEQNKGEYLGIHETKKILFSDFAREYLAFAKSTKAPSTYAGNVREMQRLLRTFDGDLSKLTTGQIEKYKVQRSQEVKPATVNRELALLKHMLTKAVEWSYLKSNPAKPVKLLKESPGRLRYLELEEVEHLLESCKDPQVPYLRPGVVMALHTGMRLDEILSLRWEHVDLKRRLISITKTKNNERKNLPINDALLAELSRLPRHVSSPYLFCHPDGTRILRIDRSFHRAMRDAGIESFRFHDLRHTFAGYLAMRGVPLEIIGALLGHKDPKMTRRYAHLSPASQNRSDDPPGSADGNKTGTAPEHEHGSGLKTLVRVVPPGRLELPAQGLGIPCSIRLSYGGTVIFQEVGLVVVHGSERWCPYRCPVGRSPDANPGGRSYGTV
jgi:integrase